MVESAESPLKEKIKACLERVHLLEDVKEYDNLWKEDDVLKDFQWMESVKGMEVMAVVESLTKDNQIDKQSLFDVPMLTFERRIHDLDADNPEGQIKAGLAELYKQKRELALEKLEPCLKLYTDEPFLEKLYFVRSPLTIQLWPNTPEDKVEARLTERYNFFVHPKNIKGVTECYTT